MTTNVNDFIGELDAGVFEEKISRAISDVALGVINNHRAGKVTITLTMKQISDSHQVTIDSKLVYDKPTAKGKLVEENTTQTPMYVGAKGAVTLFPEDQTQMFDMHGKTTSKENV